MESQLEAAIETPDVSPEVDDFDLDGLLTDVSQTTGVVDPGELASLVAPRIPPSRLVGVLVFALRHYIRIWHGRHGLLSAVAMPRNDEGEPQKQPFRRSWKYDAVEALLEHAVAVDFKWKRVGDCTPDDLSTLEKDRLDLADKNKAKAAFYGRLKRLCQRHKAERVRDLPRDVLERAAQREAK